MSYFSSQARLSPTARRALTGLAWLALGAAVVVCSLLAFTLSTADAGDATREVLFNVGHWLRWLLYVSTAVVFAIIAAGPLRRSNLWRLGRTDEKRWDRVGERAKVFLLLRRRPGAPAATTSTPPSCTCSSSGAGSSSSSAR